MPVTDIKYYIPNPIIHTKEQKLLDSLTKQYEKMLEPSKIKQFINKTGTTVAGVLPVVVKGSVSKAGKAVQSGVKQISEQEIFNQTIKYISEGYSTLQDKAAKVTINEKFILDSINKQNSQNPLNSLEELPLMRSYEISSAVRTSKIRNVLSATLEGFGTGFFGFAGIPANLALSNFLYFRAVQNVAMFYGYDVKQDNAEMVIAGEVFTQAMNPSARGGNSELSSDIIKILSQAQLTGAKQAAAKGWAAMIEKGGLPLALANIRAVANKAAQKALTKAGQKSVELGVFKEAFNQIGRKLTLKFIQRGVPVVSAGVSALIDTGEMKKVIEYADVFYNKRFILEKEQRINDLISGSAEHGLAVEHVGE